MKRQVLLVIMPNRTAEITADIAPCDPENVVAISTLLSAYGYQCILGITDRYLPDDNFFNTRELNGLIRNAVNPAFLSQTELREFSALIVCTEHSRLHSLAELDALPELTNTIGQLYSVNRLVCVQQPDYLKIINPRLAPELLSAFDLDKDNKLAADNGHERYVELMIEIMVQQSMKERRERSELIEHLQQRLPVGDANQA